MEGSGKYRAALYDSYVSGHQGEIAEARSAPAFEADILARVPAARDLAILDVGCGQGQLVRLLAQRGYRDVRGIDLSQEQIDLAQDLGTKRVERADLFAFAVEHSGEFDVIIAVDLVEHFDRSDVPRLFATLGQLLKDGGVLIIRTPNGSSPYGGRILYGDMTHGVAYTARSLSQVTAAAGFKDVVSYPVRPAGSGPKQRIRRLLWHVIEALLIIPLVVETGQIRGHIVTQNLVAVATK